jgi:predicted TIM-barrel fold metal-dependent hydrolase
MTMLSSQLGYAAIDADNHYYETPDCFTRHIEAEFRDKAITTRRRDDGSWEVKIGSTPFTFFDPKFDSTNPPGSLLSILHAKDADPDFKWSDSYSAENMRPEYKDRELRLALMDVQGIEATVMFPSFAVAVPAHMVDDPDQFYANFRAFNRWLEDEWGYGRDGRIFSTPMLSLLDVEQAVAELDRVLELGARIIAVPPGPIGNGRSPADPMYDAFWGRMNDAGAILALHLGDRQYGEVSALWGEPEDPPLREMTAFQFAFTQGDRAVMETFGQLIFGNLFGRFPDLRVLSIENGSLWVAYLLKLMDTKKGMGRYGRWIGGRPKGRPSETFKQHCWVAPYPEDDIDDLVEVLGVDRVLFGSDFPHPEGMVEPVRFAELMVRRTPAEVKRVMRDNAAELLDLQP